MVTGEMRHTVWHRVRAAHNPEVAGSNPAPATNVSAVLPQVNGPQAQLAGRFRVWGPVCVLTRSLTRIVSGVAQRLRLVEHSEGIELGLEGHRPVRRGSQGRSHGGRIPAREVAGYEGQYRHFWAEGGDIARGGRPTCYEP